MGAHLFEKRDRDHADPGSTSALGKKFDNSRSHLLATEGVKGLPGFETHGGQFKKKNRRNQDDGEGLGGLRSGSRSSRRLILMRTGCKLFISQRVEGKEKKKNDLDECEEKNTGQTRKAIMPRVSLPAPRRRCVNLGRIHF